MIASRAPHAQAFTAMLDPGCAGPRTEADPSPLHHSRRNQSLQSQISELAAEPTPYNGKHALPRSPKSSVRMGVNARKPGSSIGNMQHPPSPSRIRSGLWLVSCFCAFACRAFAEGPDRIPNTFAPASTPAHEIFDLSLFALSITGAIFISVAALLTYVCIRYRSKKSHPVNEPPQVYGSLQVELAWTVIPVLIIIVLFLTAARIIFAIQDAPEPRNALNVTVIGHQFWWEFRYPSYGFVTANELHIPVSASADSKPTFLRLISADVDHSFWVPQLAGKTDLIPNHPNEMWMDPHEPGLYLGQCAQYCGIEHAKMLIRVYVDTPAEFAAWIENQQQPAVNDPAVAAGRHIFETQACMVCHTIKGTRAMGTVGPDLTHLMSRATIAAGAALNTPANLRAWVVNPANFKPGCLMPAMHLGNEQVDELVSYLTTLR